MAGKNADDEVTRFIRELENRPGKETMLYGMVDASKDPKKDGILFAPRGDCKHWAFIPRKVIEKIERVGEAPCGAHSHLLAKIQLKAPDGDVAQAYASVADVHRTGLANVIATAARGRPPKPNYPCKNDNWVWDETYADWFCAD